VERAVARAINRQRRHHGLARLRLIPSISAVAAWHSRDLLLHGGLSHASSNGTPFSSRIRQVATARVVGETLIQFRGRYSGRAIVRAWMRSPPHRVELMNPGFRRLGVGRATRSGLSVVTADFATR
jgi:uncharacterized protein YkwD